MLNRNDFPGWPSKDEKAVIHIRLEWVELSQRYGLSFLREKDDLGWCFAGHFIDEMLGPVVFLCYDQQPQGGATIHVDKLIDSKRAVQRLTEILFLESDDLFGVMID